MLHDSYRDAALAAALPMLPPDLRYLLATAPHQLVLVLSAQGQLLWANGAAERHFDRPLVGLLRAPLLDEAHLGLDEALAEAVASGQPRQLELTLVHEGAPVRYRASLEPTYADDASVHAVLLMLRALEVPAVRACA